MTVYWNTFAQIYRNLAPPLKPSSEDVTAIEEALTQWWTRHAREDLTVLLCGVTPALAELKLPTGARLLAVELSEPMIAGIWPGNNATRAAVRGNWLDLPLAAHSCDIVVGDGCVNCLEYPRGYSDFFSSLHHVLASDGIVLMRFFVRPSQGEDVDSIFADLHAARIPSFHIFKWRLAMALQESTTAGIVVNEIYMTWVARGVQPSVLVSRLNWSATTINTITGYKDKDTRLSFPTIEEIRACLPDCLEEILIKVPGYDLGERCPLFILKSR